MAGLFEISDLEARKRALVTESEVYRETLKLELQNLQLCGIRMRRKFSCVLKAAPLILLAKPLVSLFFAERKPVKRGLFATALVGWRLYRQFVPLLSIFLQRFARRKHQRASIKESYEPET